MCFYFLSVRATLHLQAQNNVLQIRSPLRMRNGGEDSAKIRNQCSALVLDLTDHPVGDRSIDERADLSEVAGCPEMTLNVFNVKTNISRT